MTEAKSFGLRRVASVTSCSVCRQSCCLWWFSEFPFTYCPACLYLILYIYHPFVVQVFLMGFFFNMWFFFLVSTFARAQLWTTVAKTKRIKMVYSSHVSPASHGRRAVDFDAQGNSWGKEFLSIDFQWEINEKDNETQGLIRSSSAIFL